MENEFGLLEIADIFDIDIEDLKEQFYWIGYNCADDDEEDPPLNC